VPKEEVKERKQQADASEGQSGSLESLIPSVELPADLQALVQREEHLRRHDLMKRLKLKIREVLTCKRTFAEKIFTKELGHLCH
jgi:hypothetical protein